MNKPIQAFKKMITSSELKGLFKEYGEIGLDKMIEDGLLRDIPGINTLFAIYNLGSSFVQVNNFRKIAFFLNCIDDVTNEEREKFIVRLNDEDKSGKIFEQLMIQLEKLDEAIKAEMVGNIFRIYILDKITRHTFLRCCSVIERAYTSDLIALYQGLYYIIGKQGIDQSRFKTYQDNSIQLSDLNHNLMNLGILRKDLVLLTERYKKENNMSDWDCYTKSSLNYIGFTLATFIFYDFTSANFSLYIRDLQKL